MSLRRDFYWKRVGLRWQVWTEKAGQHLRIGDFSFWNWHTAAQVANEIFAAYNEGREIQREIQRR